MMPACLRKLASGNKWVRVEIPFPPESIPAEGNAKHLALDRINERRSISKILVLASEKAVNGTLSASNLRKWRENRRKIAVSSAI